MQRLLVIKSKEENHCVQEPSSMGGAPGEGLMTGTEDSLYLDIKTPKKLPSEILGVIPNFSNTKHKKLLKQYKLISVEEYIADGLGVSELKLVS